MKKDLVRRTNERYKELVKRRSRGTPPELIVTNFDHIAKNLVNIMFSLGAGGDDIITRENRVIYLHYLAAIRKYFRLIDTITDFAQAEYEQKRGYFSDVNLDTSSVPYKNFVGSYAYVHHAVSELLERGLE